MESLLVRTTLRELVENTHESLITLRWDGNLDAALQQLVDNRILSAPVISTELGGFCAFVDLADFLVFLYEQLQENIVIEGVTRLLSVARRHKVGDLADLSHRNHWMPTQWDTTLLNAMVVMSSNGIHRLPIVQPDSTLYGILTESAIVKFLESKLPELPSHISGVKIASLPCISSPVRCVQRTDKVMKAFGTMVKEKLSGLAVVNEDGTLGGNISVSDLKNVHFDMDLIARSSLSVDEYLQLGNRRAPIGLTSNDTLGDVIRTLVQQRIHRVYVVQGDGRPEAVLSMGDVLGNVISFFKAPAPMAPQPSFPKP
eukprot:RCo005102